MINESANSDTDTDAEMAGPTGWIGVIVGLTLVIASGIALHPVMLYLGVSPAVVNESFATFWPEVLVVALVATLVTWLVASVITRVTAETTKQVRKDQIDE